MSEQKMRRGKVKEFKRNKSEMIEDYFKRFYKYKGFDFIEVEDTEDLRENFSEDFYRYAIYFNGAIYEVLDDIEDDCFDIFEASKNKDGTISYVLSYYNGACCFSEALEEALKNMLYRSSIKQN